jgi:hypothetical protein
MSTRKQHIPQHVREEVWRLYGASVCWCCQQEPISSKSKHLGHIQAEAHGGRPVIENLRPVCQHCNLRMGTTNMYDFMIQQGYPIRDISMIQRILGKKTHVLQRLRGRLVFFIPEQRTGAYQCAIGTRSLLEKYPFLREVALDKLFEMSEIQGIRFLFVSHIRYSRWIRHMQERPEMHRIYQELTT